MTARPPHLAVGDLVVDREADRDQRGTAVVIRTLDTTAAETHIESLDTTVAAVNGQYPTTDPVVEVAFAGHLDRRVGNWRSMLRDARADESVSFDELLRDYREEWGVALREYAYPVSRLGPRPYCPVCSVRAAYDAPTGTYRCPVPECVETPVDGPGGDPLNADDEHPRPTDEWTRADVRSAAETIQRGDP